VVLRDGLFGGISTEVFRRGTGVVLRDGLFGGIQQRSLGEVRGWFCGMVSSGGFQQKSLGEVRGWFCGMVSSVVFNRGLVLLSIYNVMYYLFLQYIIIKKRIECSLSMFFD
jgi:hypothetical protein